MILLAVPAEHSGRSTSINMIIRTIGSAAGIQPATLITMSTGSRANPSDRGYTTAFAIAPGAGLLSLLAACGIPRRPVVPVEPAVVTAGASTVPWA